MPHPHPHPHHLPGLAHRCRRHHRLPQSRMRTTRRRHCHGKDTIATTPSTDIAAQPPPPLKMMTAISTQPLQWPSTPPQPPPSPLPSPLHLLQPLPPSSPSQQLSPLSSLPPLPPPLPLPWLPMRSPPHPHPCLHSHYCCSLRQRHCTSDTPVNGWLLCCLTLLACCVIRCPNLSTPPVMRLSTPTTTAIAAVNNCHRHCHSQR